MSDAKPPHEEKGDRPGISFGFLAICFVLAIVVIVLGVKVHRLDAQVADTQTQLTKAKSETAQAQAGLNKAKADSSQMQSEVDKAKALSADLQTQLDQSRDASTQLQAQLDKAKAQSADLQTQLDKAKAQSADLQAQITQATAGSSQLLAQLDQAKIQTMDLQSRLQKAERDIAQLQPLLLKARHMPVTTSLEKTHGGRSFTLHINNLYLQPVSVDITITGQGNTRSQSNVIGGGATLNVEKLAAGENVAIASEGYDPVNVAVQ